MIGTRIRNRWLLGIAPAASTVLIATVLLLGLHAYNERLDLVNNVAMQARLLAANATAAIVFEDGRTAAEIVGTVDASPIVLEAAIYRTDGSVMARFQRLHAKVLLGETAPPHGSTFSLGDLQIAVPVSLEKETVGSIALRVSLDDFYGELGRLVIGILLILATAAAGGIYVGRKKIWRAGDDETKMERSHLYDDQTGVLNRSALELGLSQTLLRHARDKGGSALLLIGVDGAGAGRDPLARQFGEAVVKAVGERLSKALRAEDIVARIGNSEFAIILIDAALPADAANVEQRLAQVVSETAAVGTAPTRIDLSLGVCMIPGGATGAKGALRSADLATRRFRPLADGYSHVSTKGQDVDRPQHSDIAIRLGQALTDGELFVAYQPQQSARSGRVEGLEALVRWRHPIRGIILPLEFIPVAEEAGLIGDIGRLVLEHVCRDIAELRGSGHVVPPVAVNVSPRQLDDGSIGEDITATLKKYRLPPGAVTIEMSECALIDHPEALVRTIDELAAAGIRIAIDNVGTGSMSLAYLSRLRVTMLKIDRQLISELPDGMEALALVKGLIGTGHTTGLSLTGVGVETAEQAECLKSAGCDLLQGYRVGLPMTMQELGVVLDRS